MKPHSAKIIINETGVNFFAWSIITDGFFRLDYSRRYIGSPLKTEIMWIENEHGQWAADIKNVEDLAVSSMKKIENGTFRWREVERSHYFYGDKTVKACREASRLSLDRPELLIKKLREAWDAFSRLNCLGFTILWSDLDHALLTKSLENILASRGLPPENIQGEVSFLVTSARPLAPWKERKALLEIALKYKTFETARKSPDFQRHCRKYVWLQYGYQGPEFAPDHFSRELKNIFKSSPSREYRDHLEHPRSIRQKQARAEDTLKLSVHERRLFAVARDIMHLKAYRVDVRHYFHWVMDRIFAEASAKYHVPVVWFHYAEREDILKLIRDGKAATKEGLKHSKFLFRVTEGRKVYFMEKAPAIRFLKRALRKETVRQSAEIEGKVAFQGKVRGIVRLVFSKKDIGKVRKGDILVALSTNPDLLPAMRKAAAFVADAGGITSHAAIVSRELKKPCIIGTKIATKVLKDGDLVEVDAFTGVIHVIQKI